MKITQTKHITEKTKWVLFVAAISWGVYATGNTLTGRVVAVADGDTITVLDETKQQHRVRLSGIDTPEKKQAYGQQAKKHLSDLVYKKTVTVVWHKKDRYKRIIGTVYANGNDTGLDQIKAGLAWHYKKYAHEQSNKDRLLYSEAETKARMERKGLWRDPEPLPPWMWRKQH